MKQLIIIGASGHGKVVADIAVLNGYEKIVFLDDNDAIKVCGCYPVIGKSGDVDKFEGDVFIAIGSSVIRQKIHEQVEKKRFVVLIHPNAVVADGTKIGVGTVVMAGAVINPDTTIGEGCIVNTASSIDHDCLIGNFVHVSVGAHLAGTVKVEDRTWIGAGATISNNINICSDCMIGAGTVVVKDIVEEGTYVGVPARRL